MNTKLPPDAFAYYVGLGNECRSYELVGRQYGVCKRSVLRTARRDRWQERLEEIERQAQEATDARLAKTLFDMNMRHRKLLMAVASRAATALQQHELRNAMEAVRAAEVAIKLERLMAGEPSESRAVSVEQVTRDEVSRFLIDSDEAEEWDGDDGDDERDDAGDEDGREALQA